MVVAAARNVREAHAAEVEAHCPDRRVGRHELGRAATDVDGHHPLGWDVERCGGTGEGAAPSSCTPDNSSASTPVTARAAAKKLLAVRGVPDRQGGDEAGPRDLVGIHQLAVLGEHCQGADSAVGVELAGGVDFALAADLPSPSTFFKLRNWPPPPGFILLPAIESSYGALPAGAKGECWPWRARHDRERYWCRWGLWRNAERTI